MGEMIQKKFREMLDSVSNASDEFVNKYFSNDSVDLNIDASSDTEEITEDDFETIKGETDDWFDYKGNLQSEKESVQESVEDSYKEVSDSIESSESEIEESIENEVVDNTNDVIEEQIKDKFDVDEENNSNEKIESELGINVATSAIEDEIKESSIDDLNLKVEEEIKEEPVQGAKVDEPNVENLNDDVETVKDTQYKKLSGDELIDLLNKIDNGEDFFKEIEV